MAARLAAAAVAVHCFLQKWPRAGIAGFLSDLCNSGDIEFGRLAHAASAMACARNRPSTLSRRLHCWLSLCTELVIKEQVTASRGALTHGRRAASTSSGGGRGGAAAQERAADYL